jgi:hypothetical protein
MVSYKHGLVYAVGGVLGVRDDQAAKQIVGRWGRERESRCRPQMEIKEEEEEEEEDDTQASLWG